MLILVTYDVGINSNNGSKRLRNVAKICENYGIRVQNSVFECVVNNLEFEKLKNDLLEVIDQKYDSIRYYNLGNSGRKKVTHVGNKVSIDIEEPLII